MRLCDAEAFRRVFAGAERFSGFGLFVLARRGAGNHPRLGLAISKRCAARAVDRNRIKRIVRESFRHRVPDLPIVDIVVLCTRESRQASPDRLRGTLEEAWERIRSNPWDEF